eukprot:Nk52_evm3s261 gene=Nk52_evmTU3s261
MTKQSLYCQCLWSLHPPIFRVVLLLLVLLAIPITALEFAWQEKPAPSSDTQPTGRCDHSSFAYNGNLYTFGGYNEEGEGDFTTLYKYDLTTNTWSTVATTGTAPSERSGQYAAIVDGKEFVVHAGLLTKDSSYVSDVIHLNMETLVWKTETIGSSPPAAAWGDSAAYGTKFLRYGGITEDNEYDSGKMWQLETSTWTWTDVSFKCPDGTSRPGWDPTALSSTRSNIPKTTECPSNRAMNPKVPLSYDLVELLIGQYDSTISENTEGQTVNYAASWTAINTATTKWKTDYDAGTSTLVTNYGQAVTHLTVADVNNAALVTAAWNTFDLYWQTAKLQAEATASTQSTSTTPTGTTTCGDYDCPDADIKCGIPTPSSGNRIVVVGDVMYLTGGGTCSGTAGSGTTCHLTGVHKLDLKTLQWTKLNTTADSSMGTLSEPPVASYHGLEHRQGFLHQVGGRFSSESGNKVYYDTMYKFDLATLKWSKDTSFGTPHQKVWSATLTNINDILYSFAGCRPPTYFDNSLTSYFIASVSGKQSTAQGPVLSGGVAGTPELLTVQAKGPDGNDLKFGGTTVTAFGYESSGAGYFSGGVTDHGNGTYSITNEPSIAGKYSLSVTLHGEEVAGSPFSLTVKAGAAAASTSKLDNPEIALKPTAGQAAALLIDAFDQFSNPNSEGNAVFLVEIAVGARKSARAADTLQAVHATGNQYAIPYTFSNAGAYTMKIFLQDSGGARSEISGSPYTVQVQEASTSLSLVIIIVIAVIGGVVGIFLICLIVYFYRRYKRLQRISNLEWKVEYEEIEIELTPEGQKSTFSFHSAVSETSKKSLTAENKGDNFIDGYEIGVYLGEKVLVEVCPREDIFLSNQLLEEMFHIWELRSDNLLSVIGACVDKPDIVILQEFPSKGMLQDILNCQKISLDMMFKFSLMTDVLSGLEYLHRQMGPHGQLSTHTVFVDSRWSAKVGGYGLLAFRTPSHENEMTDLIKAAREQWLAPELLVEKDENHDEYVYTKNGDVYSAGLVLNEILSRDEPWGSVDYTWDEIREMLVDDPGSIRPQLIEEESTPELQAVIESAWNADPEERPDCHSLKGSVRRLNPDRNVSVVEKVAEMLSKYAADLEKIVAEKTESLQTEQVKTYNLLLNMLPESIVKTLMTGGHVSPESFSQATVFFSDIIGYGKMAETYGALDIVDFLNDVYSTFDAVIDDSNLDVYKVETVGDNYVIVSGVPIPCENRHSEQICLLALEFMAATCNFRIRKDPTAQLQLRIGIHTGPIVAGVVGLKMPRYCLFGDTMNVSSRMMSGGLALRIHMSDAVKQNLDVSGGFVTESRGEREVKGKGKMTTHWLIGHESFHKQRPDLDRAASLSQHYFK